MKQVTVRVPGSCGELVQGMINGQNFLITCPINCYSEVAVSFDMHRGTQQTPERNRLAKTRLAVARTLQYFRKASRNFHVSITSSLPVGKGMASSSADISAACIAAAKCLDIDVTPRQIADIALSIEPTDAVFFPGVIMFDHRSGSICEHLGQPPGMEVLIFDTGGAIDTLSFNARADLLEHNTKKERAVKEAVSLIREGINTGDLAMIGKAATISALENQGILKKERLEEVLHLALRFGAVGVNVAHSGTVIGILLDPQASVCRRKLSTEICRGFGKEKFLQRAKLIGGGWQIIPDKELNDDIRIGRAAGRSRGEFAEGL